MRDDAAVDGADAALPFAPAGATGSGRAHGSGPDDRPTGPGSAIGADATPGVEERRPRRLRGATAVLVALAAVTAVAQLLPPVPASTPDESTTDSADGDGPPRVDLGGDGTGAAGPLAWEVEPGAVALRGGPVVDVSTGRPAAGPVGARTTGPGVAGAIVGGGRLVERPNDQPILVELARDVVVASDVRTGRHRWTADVGSPVLELKVVDGALGVLFMTDVAGNRVGRLDPARGTVMTLVTGPTTDHDGAAAERWAIDDTGVAVATADGVVLTPWRRDASLLPVDGVREVALAGDHVAVHRRTTGGDVVELWDRRDRSLVVTLPVVDDDGRALSPR